MPRAAKTNRSPATATLFVCGYSALWSHIATVQPDYLIDLVMPEQEGIETIKAIRAEYPDAKVIAMSGAFGGDYLRIAGYLGAHGTLAKPLQMAGVLKAVADALGSADSPAR